MKREVVTNDAGLSGYLERNLAEQQVKAAQFLRWTWSNAAKKALTKYKRCLEGKPLSKSRVYSNSLDEVQRELCGITLEYGQNRALELELNFNEEFFQEFGILQFAFESNGVPRQFIDLDGQVHDDKFVFSDARTFVEWYVALRNFHFYISDHNPVIVNFEVSDRELSEVKNIVQSFATANAMTPNKFASDSKNMMWLAETAELCLRHSSAGQANVFLYTSDQQLASSLKEWCQQYGI